MTISYTPLSLTRKLLAFDTVNPPGNERAMAAFIGELLEDGGFTVEAFEFAEYRTSLIARKIFDTDRDPICFSGHMDTVPLGLVAWKRDPFKGEVAGDRLFGRGASDMKSGLAAMLLAALAAAAGSGGRSGIQLVLTAGEENGCQGAEFLAGLNPVLGKVGALVVGEPTANYPMLGHKGAFWLKAAATGLSAHGSMPSEGVNAIYTAARAISRLERYEFDVGPHPVLGRPTLNVGTISGGSNINSVPDRAEFTIDIRTVPPQSGRHILSDLTTRLGPDIELEVLTDQRAVASDPANPWIQETLALMQSGIGAPLHPRGVTYFTDASALATAFGHPPILILGPGRPEMAHKTDEYCRISDKEADVDIYLDIAKRWCRL
jgi:succinyl-diaminopimelate desuccinylase